MATTQVVKVVIEELSKYGFKANGKYVGLSKNLSDADKAQLVPGAAFEAEYYVADSGKEYLNKILSAASVSVPEARTTEAKPDKERAKKFTPSFTKKSEASDNERMTKADWNQKDRNMMIGGRSHDAAVIVAAMVNIESLDTIQALARYHNILEGMLKIAEEVK